MQQGQQPFLVQSPEDSNFNQYWFSQKSIDFLTNHIEELNKEFQEINKRPLKCCFVSTPSIYCSLKSQDLREQSILLEFDEKFKIEKGFVFYDFNKPLDLPAELKGNFDFILIDPPFITEEVWTKYSQTAKFLSCQSTKLLLCSILENDKLLKQLLDVNQCVCKPSIPNLIYQYNFYSNYSHPKLDEVNQEIGY